MAETRVSRLLELFEEALERPETERQAYLERECGGDAQLLAGALELLAEHVREDGFLDRGAGLAAALPDEDPDDLAGTVLGAYRITGELGEGGMGVVYRAEQTEPVRRQVALKLLKRGMDTRSVVRRFEAERQALALMEHPGIASILDGGVSPDGRPWFVMELVEGRPITAFCDEHRLGLRERLGLVLEVAAAVEHAHRRGIIHRDLKPSNLLVRELDGRPAPKVIDFGIARIADASAGARTLTRQGFRVGTPEYMSPEQAAGQLDIDTRTDVYSLGVVLYELLAGDLPGAAAEVAPTPTERRDPPTPSARLRRLSDEEVRNVAALRGTEPGELRRHLGGELDWIVLKALAAERERRYGSIAELSDDLRRYLEDRPVSAGPPSLGYRARKFARRHRPTVVAGAVAAAAILGGLGAVAWSAVAALRAQAATEAALEEARYEAETTGAVTDLLFEMLGSADPESSYAPPAEARDLRVVDVLDRAGVEAGERFAERPRLEAEVRALVGQTLLHLQQLDQAEPHLERALALWREIVGPEGAETLAVRYDLAALAGSRGQNAESASLHRAVLEDRRRVLGPDHEDTLASATRLADALMQLGEHDDAEKLYLEALERGARGLGEAHLVVTQALNGLAYLARLRGDAAAAAESYARVVELRRGSVGPDHPATLSALNNLAAAVLSDGRPEEAERLYRQLLERHDRVFGPGDPRTQNSRSNLGVALWRLGRLDEAADLFRAVAATNTEVLGPDHPQTLLSRNNLGRMLLDQERFDEAEAEFRDLIPRAERALPPGHVNLALYRGSYGLVLLRAERWAEAEPLILAAQSGLEEALGPDHPRVRTQNERLVALYEGWGREEDAARWRARLPVGG